MQAIGLDSLLSVNTITTIIKPKKKNAGHKHYTSKINLHYHYHYGDDYH